MGLAAETQNTPKTQRERVWGFAPHPFPVALGGRRPPRPPTSTISGADVKIRILGPLGPGISAALPLGIRAWGLVPLLVGRRRAGAVACGERRCKLTFRCRIAVQQLCCTAA
jgi:hypothetical protein